MPTTALLLLPLFTAFTGWCCLRLLIYFLFRPLRPVRFLGMRVQGVFPARQKQIAAALGRAIAAEMPATGDIALRLADPAKIAALMPGIEKHIDEFLQLRLKEKIPVLAMFLSDNILQTIKAGLTEEIEAMLPQVITQYAGTLGSGTDLPGMVAKKIDAISSEKLEGMLYAAAGKELRMIPLAGAAVGFLIGMIQMALYLCL